MHGRSGYIAVWIRLSPVDTSAHPHPIQGKVIILVYTSGIYYYCTHYCSLSLHQYILRVDLLCHSYFVSKFLRELGQTTRHSEFSSSTIRLGVRFRL